MENILAVAHVGINVTDLEKSISFYRDVLELPLIQQTQWDNGDGTFIKVAFIKVGDNVLELMQQPNAVKKPEGVIHHIAFRVKEIDKLADYYRGKGIKFDTEKSVHAPHFFSNGCSWIIFSGPDGESLELHETF